MPHRILVSTEEQGVYVVWHAGWIPGKAIATRLPRRDDSPTFDLQGIDVLIDGRRIDPLDADAPPPAAPPPTAPAANVP